MGVHEDELVGVEYANVQLAIMWDENRDNPVELARIADAARAFAARASLRVAQLQPDMVSVARVAQPFVLVEGGLVQNNPTVPVLDLDVLEGGADFPGAVDEVRALLEAAAAIDHPYTRDVVELCKEWLGENA